MNRMDALRAYQDYYVNRYLITAPELHLAQQHLYICRIVLCCLDNRIDALPEAKGVCNEM